MILRASTKFRLLFLLVFVRFYDAEAQNFDADRQSHSNYTAISTSFPFLRIMPDPRTAAMGEAGVARTPDVNSLSINPAALVFNPYKASIGVSHNPWLKSVIKDVNLSYFSAYLNSGEQAIGMSLRYFSVGETTFRDEHALTLGMLHPVEYAFDISYARKLGPGFSLGASARYAQSRLQLNDEGLALQNAGAALAVDVSAYMIKPTNILGYDADLSGGIYLSNLGPGNMDQKTQHRYTLPTNLRLGTAAALNLDQLSRFSIAADLNKLLVPSNNEQGNHGYPNNQQVNSLQSNNQQVSNPQRSSFPAGILRSFSDRSFAEELAEISMSLGLEWTFKQQFSLRTGYLYEHPGKGNRRYISFGAGMIYRSMSLDLAYLPVNTEKSPMANTLKIGLMFNFGQFDERRPDYVGPK